MATKEKVENWIIDYALRKNYHDVVKALLQHNHEAIHAPNMEIRLMMCTLNKIISQEDSSQFSLAANIVDFISRSVGKFCSVKLYGKIIYMLRMKMLLQHLQKDTFYVLVLLNKNLPRCGLQFDNVNMKELKKLNERISSFRKFFLTLVASESTKQSYFAEEYEKEFGEDFMIRLKQFVQIFMDRINSHLPKTMLEQIFDRRDLIKHHPTSVAIEILLDCMHGKTSLSAGELYNCWHQLNSDPDKGNVKGKCKTYVIKSSRVSNRESLDDLLSIRNLSKRNPVTQNVPCSSKSDIVYSVIDIRQSLRSNSSSEETSQEATCARGKGHNHKSSNNETFISVNRKTDGAFDVENPKSEATLVSKQPNKGKFRKLAEYESDEISFDSDRLKGKGSISLDQCVTGDDSSAYPEEVIVSSGTLESSDSESILPRREMVVVPQSSENTQEQVYIISSSSDSHPDSGGSHPILLDEQQGDEKQEEDCRAPIRTYTINSSNSFALSSPDIFEYTADETDSMGASTNKPELEEDRSSGGSLSNVFDMYHVCSDDEDDDCTDSLSVVPPSTIEDAEDVELWDLGGPIFNEHYSRSEGENLPEIRMHLKNERMRLCLVKLYRKQDLVCTDSVTGQQLDIYV
ncbi:hypothetical protein CHS0354_017446 [Potamilus streckersoni]|uniref:TERF1-interacting nuclear factor 2 N-terminal domain-containing protein n=1 Tax=Potamilus streckersoni TaxID=2493646 RepID=A0AAE0SC06_9BIVA|nr:hypothetical protein CHS0354_017446 [Potamilus streckersoni]